MSPDKAGKHCSREGHAQQSLTARHIPPIQGNKLLVCLSPRKATQLLAFSTSGSSVYSGPESLAEALAGVPTETNTEADFLTNYEMQETRKDFSNINRPDR